VKRKIAAILAADIAGYSRLVAEDEEETLRRLETYRAVFSDLIARFGGRVFNTAGDAMLAEFRSAVDAVRCAVDVQESLRTRNRAYAPSRHMNYRVGIAIGDVVERDDDLLGDGVNIASRLEGIAPISGICISRSVYEAVANKISLKFSDLGQQKLKNMPERVRAYTVVLDQQGAKPWSYSAAALWGAGVLAVVMLVALGNAVYLLSRPGAHVEPSFRSIASGPGVSEQRAAARNGAATKSPTAAAPDVREVKLASKRTDREASSDATARAAAPVEAGKRGRDASPNADAAAVTLALDRAPSPVAAKTAGPIEKQVESCRKYLPSIGRTVKVPCEEAKKIEPIGVQAPELTCDRLAAAPYDSNHVTQGIEFKVMDGPKAVEACREAVRLYPQTSRFKFQLARALDRSAAYEEAIQLYRQLADAGYANAISNLGALYDQGHGVAKDKIEAFRLFRQAAKKGVASAMNLVGRMYAAGDGVAMDEAAAARWFRKGAEAGNREAMVNLGTLYATGSGVPKDRAETFRLYRQAVEKGEPTVMNRLGWMYENGLGTTKDDQEAFRLYRQAADKGDVLGVLNLGRLYAEGRGVTRDEAQAVRLFRQASQQGADAGTYDLAMMYEQGRGVAKDEAEAARLYRQTARRGNARAMYALGRMYLVGRGVPRDEAEAARWIFLAIEHGDPGALRQMTTNASAWGPKFRKALQRRLQAAGLYSGPSDGKFGPAVANAIEGLAARAQQQ